MCGVEDAHPRCGEKKKKKKEEKDGEGAKEKDEGGVCV